MKGIIMKENFETVSTSRLTEVTQFFGTEVKKMVIETINAKEMPILLANEQAAAGFVKKAYNKVSSEKALRLGQFVIRLINKAIEADLNVGQINYKVNKIDKVVVMKDLKTQEMFFKVTGPGERSLSKI
jgi:hypothetical protein